MRLSTSPAATAAVTPRPYTTTLVPVGRVATRPTLQCSDGNLANGGDGNSFDEEGGGDRTRRDDCNLTGNGDG